MESTQSTPKTGRFRRGWELTKSCWRVLTLDKELTILPALSMISSVVAAILVIGGFAFTLIATHHGNYSSNSPVPFAVIGICLYAFLAIIANFFGGAVVYGATERFRGGDPTVRGSIAGASRKFRPLMFFSLMMATVGLALQALEDRVPFVGKIALQLVGAAWSIANVFAVPVIVLSDKNVRPFEATRESINIIRRVWGESIAVDLGITLVGIVSFIGYFGFWGLAVFAAVQLGNVPGAVLAVAIPIAILGFIALLVIFSTLTSIAKAALYYYATTGKAPELFNQELLQASMTPKKAHGIFA